MNASKRVAVVDFHTDGHHQTYILLYVQALLEWGHAVLIFYPIQSIFIDLQNKFGEKLQFYLLPNINLEHKPLVWRIVHKILSLFSPAKAKSFIATQLWQKTIRALNGKGEFDHVIFPCLDTFFSLPLPTQARSFPYPWSGLCVNLKKKGQFTIPWNTLGLEKIPLFKALYVLDETATQEIQQMIKKPVYAWPDVTNESAEVDMTLQKNIYQKARSRKIVLSIGAIASRKGIISFIQTVQQSDPKKFFFVIAGKVYEDTFEKDELALVKQFLENPPENCLVVLGRIDDGTPFNTFVQTADVIYAAYIGFMNSSNLLTKATLFKKPLIVTKDTLLAQRIKTFHLGTAVDVYNPKEIVRAISLLTTEPMNTAQFPTYFSLHSYTMLCKKLTSVLALPA